MTTRGRVGPKPTLRRKGVRMLGNTERIVQGLLAGTRQQVLDGIDIAKHLLTGDYAPQDAIADTLAWSINAWAAVLGCTSSTFTLDAVFDERAEMAGPVFLPLDLPVGLADLAVTPLTHETTHDQIPIENIFVRVRDDLVPPRSALAVTLIDLLPLQATLTVGLYVGTITVNDLHTFRFTARRT